MELKKLYDELRSTWEQMKRAMDAQAEEVKRYGDASEEIKKQVAALNARIDELEVKMKRVPLGGPSERQENPAKSAYLKAIRLGRAALDETELQYVPLWHPSREEKSMIAGDDTTGGFLAPSEFVTEIIRGVVDFSPIRSLARVRTTSNRSILAPVRKGTLKARWVSETGERTPTGRLVYGREEIPTHELYAEIIVSEQDLEDSAFDLEAEILNEASEQFGVAEGEAFILGDGIGKPEGLLFCQDVEVTVSGHASELTADGLIRIAYDLKAPYARNGTWIANRRTIGKIRMLKDQNGNFIWQPGLAVGQPNTILDRPYVEAVDMPDVAPGSFPVLFGDIRRAYTIVDRIQVVTKRLTEKYAESGEIAILLRRRVGGQVVLPEAVRKLKIAQS